MSIVSPTDESTETRAPQGGGGILEVLQDREEKQQSEKINEFSPDDFRAGETETETEAEPESLFAETGQAEPESVDHSGAKREEAEATAKYFCEIYETGLSYMLSAISGKSPDGHGFTKQQRNQIESKGALYFETVNFNISPGAAFAAAVALPTSIQVFEAYEEKKQKQKAARRKWLQRQAEAEMELRGTVSEELKEEYTETASSGEAKIDGVTESRNQFDIDKEGYFRKNNKGRFMKGEKPPWLKAPAWVIEITESMQGRKQGEINKACREELKRRINQGA